MYMESNFAILWLAFLNILFFWILSVVAYVIILLLLLTKLIWTILYKSFCGCMHWYLLDEQVVLKLPVSKVVVPFHHAISSTQEKRFKQCSNSFGRAPTGHIWGKLYNKAMRGINDSLFIKTGILKSILI